MRSYIAIFILTLLSVSAHAADKWPTEMPDACSEMISQIEEVRDGSVSSSHQDIMDGLKYDWKTYPEHFKAVYSDCGSSDFFYIEIDKATCEVIDVGSGDSDGECEL
jgi:hypothetical protein